MRPKCLETVVVDVPEAALQVYEMALSTVCVSVGFFQDPETGAWRVEGVKPVGDKESQLSAALALAAALTGIKLQVKRLPTKTAGWLAQIYASFPQQLIGRRFAVRGTHLRDLPSPGRITLTLDAGLAFGSGEHGSTRGCLRALEWVARRRPRHILDLGTGSGILALAAASLLHRSVLATDIDPQSVHAARKNVALNRLTGLVRVRLADGWRSSLVSANGPYDLVLANILARPLCLMARQLAVHLAPGGMAILSGLLRAQERSVLSAHRRHGLRLATILRDGAWTTMVLRR